MKVITCFSYKGGTGRTVAAANISAALASIKSIAFIEKPLNFKVALLDLDVFSAGLYRVFDISDPDINKVDVCVQDYLLKEIAASTYLKENAITPAHKIMDRFGLFRGGRENCREDFTFFPSKPNPDQRFSIAKYHENVLIELLIELEKEGFDYVVIDGESGIRSMALIAQRLSDILLMLFRLTPQHIEGTLKYATAFLKNEDFPAFHLIPTIIPLVDKNEGIYKYDAPGLIDLRNSAESVPEDSGLNEFAKRNEFVGKSQLAPGPGYFWAKKIAIHESLILRGTERVIVYDTEVSYNDRAAQDFYQIASEISRLYPPGIS